MKALITKLRRESECRATYPEDALLMREASDEIERLSAENSAMREALLYYGWTYEREGVSNAVARNALEAVSTHRDKQHEKAYGAEGSCPDDAPASTRQKQKLINPSPNPRYDDVYEEGVKNLD